MSRSIRLLVPALLLGGLGSCVSPLVSYGGPVTAEGIEVTVDGVIRRFGRVLAVEGTARNVGQSDQGHLRLVFELLDDDGAKIGDATAQSEGLRAGQLWRFDAAATVKFHARVDRVRLDRVELGPALKLD
ncbi:FxLYD domain-containing protein [Engelhardtia mirabilis]